jgi:hypothetical protein
MVKAETKSGGTFSRVSVLAKQALWTRSKSEMKQDISAYLARNSKGLCV